MDLHSRENAFLTMNVRAYVHNTADGSPLYVSVWYSSVACGRPMPSAKCNKHGILQFTGSTLTHRALP